MSSKELWFTNPYDGRVYNPDNVVVFVVSSPSDPNTTYGRWPSSEWGIVFFTDNSNLGYIQYTPSDSAFAAQADAENALATLLGSLNISTS